MAPRPPLSPFRLGSAALLPALMLAACAAGTPDQPDQRDTPAQVALDGRPGLSQMTHAAPLASGSLAGAFLAGRQAQFEGDPEAAASHFAEAARLAPEALALKRRAAFFLTTAGRFPEAVPLAREVMAADHDEASLSRLMVATDQAARGDFPGALATLAEASSEGGLNQLLIPLVRAWLMVGDGRPAEALEVVVPLAEAEEPFARLFAFHGGLIAAQAGQRATAAELFGRLTEVPEELPLRTVEAIAAFRLADPDSAPAGRDLIATYLKAHGESRLAADLLEPMRLAPVAPPPPITSAADGLAEAFHGTASNMAQSQALDTALLFIHLALAVKPEFDYALILKGDLASRQRRPVAAVAAYRAVPADSAFTYLARQRAADSLGRAERLEEAREAFESLAADWPERPEPLIDLGDLLRQNERFAEAVEAYDRAFARLDQVLPRHWSWLYGRGIALERSGQWPRAEDDFRQALALEPDQPFVLNYLGYSWLDQGMHVETAKDMIQRAVAQRPRDGYIVDSMGWAEYLTGNHEAAVEHLERAVSLTPNDPTINDHLGDAYWRVGRRLEAGYQWQRALSFDPDPELADTIRAKLDDGLDDAPSTN
ncbi:tetratricopeptide repeat protein [Roseospirillum parvum]|uniref:TPR repeat-containing protein n=1 Tax=Roseospirillum parvum TaxID=83401 RepID=A0A1G7W4U2_9PROT|nr:tetratricopeptide repeat protein [Roseospirillum parvum]SDG66953.1 TPR repeat-containing protein [Roseospirillum parvum]